MGDNVDVRALRAKFQAEKALSISGASPRPPAAAHTPGYSANGGVRNKLSPVIQRPVLPMNSNSEPKRYGNPPHGVFPKPPPSHRAEAKEEPKAPFKESEITGRVKQTGELLQTRMLKSHEEHKLHLHPKPPLPSQKSISDVPPLRKPLPVVGQRPSKPKRPPLVSLDHLRKKALSLPRCQQVKTSEGPGRPPNKPSHLTPNKPIFSHQNLEHEQDTYDDIGLPPPPPTPPKPPSRESWTGSFSSQADEGSDQSEIYEHIDNEGESSHSVSEKKKEKETKQPQHLEMKEQKEKQKKENEYLKKFKLTGPVEVLHIARVREDCQGGKNDLRVRQGENIEIVRVKNNPEGKWLARNMNREYGYISNTCVDVDYEEVKRKLRLITAPFAPPQEPEDIYDDIGSEGEVYDDIEVSSEEFPPPPLEICHNPKKEKKQEKEEKEFRKKFKFEGPIKVLSCMMVDPNANIKKAGGKELSVVRGEILEVIQQTTEKKVLCRNEKGKYGYVPRCYLLQAEGEIYDDIDNMTDVYDNDASLSGPFRP